MIIDCKYLTWYFNIIKAAKLRILDNSIYTEKHHIIPRCFGGSNCKDNIAVLTAKEHFICHLLLPKFTTGMYKRKMTHAAFMLARFSSKQQRYKITSRWYAVLRKNISIQMTGIKQKPRSKEWSRNIAIAKKGRALSDQHKQALTGIKLGKPWSLARKMAGKSIVTPFGIFESQAEAERQLNLGKNVIAYRIKTQPTKYYVSRTNSRGNGGSFED